MASNVDVSYLSETTTSIVTSNRAHAKTALDELARLTTVAQTQDPTSQLPMSAKVIQDALSDIKDKLSEVQSEIKDGNTDPALKTAWDKGNYEVQQIKQGVSRLNNTFQQAGISGRLAYSDTAGVTSTVTGTAQSTPSSTPAVKDSRWSDGLTSGATGPGLNLDQDIPEDLQKSPLYPKIKAAIEKVVQTLTASTSSSSAPGGSQPATASAPTASGSSSKSSLAETPDASTASSSTDTSGATGGSTTSAEPTDSSGDDAVQAQIAMEGGTGGASAKTGGPNAATAGEDDSAGIGEGSSLFNMFLKALKNQEDNNNGTTSSSNPKAAAKKTKATTTGTGKTATGSHKASKAAVAPVQGGGDASTTSGTGAKDPGQITDSGNDNLPIGNFAGDDTFENAGAGGDPLIGQPNINAFLMVVLLECYQEGQKDLETLAQRLQDINNQKKALRTQLAGLRTKGDNSAAVQDAEDKLNSLGDDSQLEQLDLQNMAQNQQQLLQMISNFSKNTSDDSLAIIRHIGGG